MKKILALLMLMIMLCSCGQKNNKEIRIKKDFQIGVIRTCDNRNSTILSLYDKDLRVIENKEIKYGGVRNAWSTPIWSEGHLLVNAQGLQGEKKLGLTMDIDTENGKIRFVKNDLVGPSHCIWGKHYIYVCNNLNMKSTIVRMDKDGNNRLKKEIAISLISAIYEWNDKVIVFGERIGTKTESILYVFDTDFNILKQENITNIGCGIYNVCLYENNLYFNMSSDTNDEAVYKLGVLSLDNYEIKTIDLEEINACTLKLDGSKLYISNSHHDHRPMLGVYDLETKEYQIYDLEQSVEKMEVRNGTVYALYDGTIYVYGLKDGNVTLENEVNVDTSLEEEKFYYDSVIFDKG